LCSSKRRLLLLPFDLWWVRDFLCMFSFVAGFCMAHASGLVLLFGRCTARQAGVDVTLYVAACTENFSFSYCGPRGGWRQTPSALGSRPWRRTWRRCPCRCGPGFTPFLFTLAVCPLGPDASCFSSVVGAWLPVPRVDIKAHHCLIPSRQLDLLTEAPHQRVLLWNPSGSAFRLQQRSARQINGGRE